MICRKKRLSDFVESIIPTLDLTNNHSFDSSFVQETEELLAQPERTQFFTIQGRLDQKVAHIENLITIMQNNMRENERIHHIKALRVSKQDRLMNRAMLGFFLPIKNIKN